MELIFPIAVIILLVVCAVLWCFSIYKRKGTKTEYAAAIVVMLIAISSVFISDFETNKEPASPEVGRVMFTISCETVQDEDKFKRAYVYPRASVVLYQGESIYDVLNRVAMENKIVVESGGTPLEAYITAIGGIVSGEHGGEGSYWTYYVNRDEPNISSDRYIAQPGDEILWYFIEGEQE